jgi:hypothetical protein
MLLSFTGFSLKVTSGNPSFDITFNEKSHIVSTQDIFLECKVINDRLFAMSVGNGMKSYDISEIEHPAFLDDINEICYTHHFEIQDELAFLADAGFGIKIINISNPSNLEKIGQYYPNNGAEIYSLHVSDNLLVASEWHDSLGYSKMLIINITDPTTPTNISTYDDGISTFIRFLVEDDLCYAASQNNGLKIFNFSNLEDVAEIIHNTDLISPFNFKKINDTIYIADDNKFKVLDVSNISSITKIGGYIANNFVMDIGIHDSIAFISEREEGLIALNIFDPSNPQKIGQFDTLDILSFDFDEQYLYLALVDYGIKIVEYNVTTLITSESIFPRIFELFVIFGIIYLSKRLYWYIKKM